MAFAKTLVADGVVQRLIETQGIYSYCNRSYDGLVRPGATTVTIPKLALLTVKTTGTAPTGGDRVKAHYDTTMATVTLGKAVVPIADEIIAQFESNGMLLREYITSAGLSFQEYFDKCVITEALTTSNSIDAFSVLTWNEIVAINKALDVAKVPKTGRILAISANLADEFYSIDVVKNAMAYNIAKLETGQFLSIMGMKFFISALVPQATGKNQIVGFYGPGLAFILSRYMELKQSWDGENLLDVNDMLCHFGYELLNADFAVKGAQE